MSSSLSCPDPSLIVIATLSEQANIEGAQNKNATFGETMVREVDLLKGRPFSIDFFACSASFFLK
jgi:hypothetical protein